MASWHLGNMYSSGLHGLDRDDEGKTVHCFHTIRLQGTL
jgi:hypothetical protein